MTDDVHSTDVDFESEEELGGIASAQAKLKKLKDELAKVKAERQEYLDGWQRCKADNVNAKKDVEALTETVYGGEIKALNDGDAVGGYAVLFGNSDMPDMSQFRDYFTKDTDFWLGRFGWPRPMTYHHGMERDTHDDPIVGTWTKARVDDVGIWLEGQLDQAHKYHSAIKELVRRGYLKLSSDSAPQWVVRERQPNGTNEVRRWPLLTASPTVTPAEPRLSGISFKALLDELGVEEQAPIEAKADDRARAMSLELDLIEIEEGIPA